MGCNLRSGAMLKQAWGAAASTDLANGTWAAIGPGRQPPWWRGWDHHGGTRRQVLEQSVRTVCMTPTLTNTHTWVRQACTTRTTQTTHTPHNTHTTQTQDTHTGTQTHARRTRRARYTRRARVTHTHMAPKHSTPTATYTRHTYIPTHGFIQAAMNKLIALALEHQQYLGDASIPLNQWIRTC
jgi:hypothetical protein